MACEKLRVSVTGGSITGKNGKYLVKTDKAAETVIEVSAEIRPGEMQSFGNHVFRVKRIPDPTICVGRHCDRLLNLSKKELLEDPSISVSLNIPLDLKFEVVSFTETFMAHGDVIEREVAGNRFDQELVDLVAKAENLEKIFLENIKVRGPGGTRDYPLITIHITKE